MNLCPDCEAAERDPLHCVYTTALCCMARSVAQSVGRSGKGWSLEDVQSELLDRVTALLTPREAQEVRVRAYALLGVEA